MRNCAQKSLYLSKLVLFIYFLKDFRFKLESLSLIIGIPSNLLQIDVNPVCTPLTRSAFEHANASDEFVVF